MTYLAQAAMDICACQCFVVDQTQVGTLHLLVLYIRLATSEESFTMVECVEMEAVYARAGVVVHGKPQLLACMELVTCLRHLGRQSHHGAPIACGQRNYASSRSEGLAWHRSFPRSSSEFNMSTGECSRVWQTTAIGSRLALTY